MACENQRCSEPLPRRGGSLQHRPRLMRRRAAKRRPAFVRSSARGAAGALRCRQPSSGSAERRFVPHGSSAAAPSGVTSRRSAALGQFRPNSVPIPSQFQPTELFCFCFFLPFALAGEQEMPAQLGAEQNNAAPAVQRGSALAFCRSSRAGLCSDTCNKYGSYLQRSKNRR